MSNIKIEQQESAFKKEITTILKTSSKNILFKNITITDVKITKDNSYATVYWATYLDNLDITNIAAALENAKGFCRSELAKVSSKYKVPQLRFKYDDSPHRIEKINHILENIKTSNSSNNDK